MEFRTKEGAGTIFFDQGLGSWSATTRVEFDHSAPIFEQIDALRKPLAVANGPEGTFVALRLVSPLYDQSKN